MSQSTKNIRHQTREFHELKIDLRFQKTLIKDGFYNMK